MQRQALRALRVKKVHESLSVFMGVYLHLPLSKQPMFGGTFDQHIVRLVYLQKNGIADFV